MTDKLAFKGIEADPEDEKLLILFFDREPSYDEMLAIQTAIIGCLGPNSPAMTTPSSIGELVKRLREWALDKSASHHRLARESVHLRTEHIASSAAYRSLAEELEALTAKGNRGDD